MPQHFASLRAYKGKRECVGSRDRSHLGLSSHDDKGELRNETEVVVVAVREGGREAPPNLHLIELAQTRARRRSGNSSVSMSLCGVGGN